MEYNLSQSDIERRDRMADIMCFLSGIPQDIFWTTRQVPAPWCRAVIAHELMRPGTSLGYVGELMGKNHATVVHMLHAYDNAMGRPTYERENDIARRFYAVI